MDSVHAKANNKKHAKTSSIQDIRESAPGPMASMRNKSPGSTKKNNITNKLDQFKNAKEKTEFYNSLVHVC